MRNLIIYGGTFDPPHNGHINTAIDVQNHFNFERFIFLPCKKPVLKNQAIATASQRVDMLKLALADQDPSNHFTIDLSEIFRETPSYTVDSLQHFRQLFGEEIAIVLLMGADTFNQLPHWHEWHKLLTLANILVINRQGYDEQEFCTPVKELLKQHKTENDQAISKQSHGLIYCYNAGYFNFSSSWIRSQLLAGNDLTNCLAEPVKQYIKENNLYNPLKK